MELIISNQSNTIEKRYTVEEAGVITAIIQQRSVFERELQEIAQNSRDAYRNDVKTWGKFLAAANVDVEGRDWFNDPTAWRGVTSGLVGRFVEWMKEEGFAIGSINRKLACVRKFASMASQAGVISQDELSMIQAVKLIKRDRGIEIDKQRPTKRVERPQAKKAENVRLGIDQASGLKNERSATPQGRRDALLMCLLLDHGLRAGELAALEVTDFNLSEGTFSFYREKVKKTQTHNLEADTLRALRAYVDSGDCPALGAILRGSLKSGELSHSGMQRESISRRVKELGKVIGIKNLSAHDCRHYWTTRAIRAGSDPFAVKQAGGWNSMSTVSRYVDENSIANAGVRLK